jgi:RNA polymerase sigma factor (sigma-70 family)
MGESRDAEIIEQSRVDRTLFAEIFERHFTVIDSYLERRVGRDRADDLGAEVFRVAFQRRDRFRPLHETALPWLYGIASNLVHEEQRSEMRRLRALARLERQALDPEPAAERVGERLDAEVMRRPLFDALSRLEVRDRTVLLLVAWEDLTYEEVAEALDVPVGTVRSRLNRARRTVRDALEIPVLGGSDA